MAEARGVFTLDRLRARVKKGTWVTPDEVFFGSNTLGPSPNTAYTAGGAGSSIVDKTTLSDGTTSRVPGANLTIARSYPGSVGSMNHGYVNGGWSPAISTLERITYSSDTTAAVPGANGVVNRYAVKAAGNTTEGYWGGGSVPGVNSTVNRLSYASETYSTTPSTFLSQNKYHLSAAGTNDAGFFMGGSTDGVNVLTEVDKLTYAVGTTFRLPGANLPQATAGWAASAAASPRSISSGGVYYAGGRLQSNGPHTSNVSKMTYSAETTSLLPTTLSAIRYIADGTGNSTHGYFIGGSNPGSGGDQSTIDKWDFSNDTTSNLSSSGNLSSNRSGHTSFSAKEAEKPEILPGLQQQNLKGQSDPNRGYTGGGYNGSGAISTVNKLYFSTDSIGFVPSSYSLARYYVAGTGSLTAGYGGGGRGGAYSTMDKTTYSTDTSVAVPAAALSSARYGCSALGTKESGYFAGGEANPGLRSLTDKLTYATDTTAQLPGTNLTEAGNFQSNGGSGNQGKGYVAGFPSTQTKIDRLDYSTETFSTVTGAQLSSNRPYLTAVSNSESGYFAGGFTGPQYSTVDKLNFSTETLSASFPMASNRSHPTSTGNESNAYIIGSQNPGLSSTEKISYTTDSASLLPSANTPTSTLAGAAGNSAAGQGGLLKRVATPTLNQSLSTSGIPNFGYIAEGSGPGPAVPLSSIGKYNFETDTRLPFTGQLSIARYIGASGSSSTAGYIAMGLGYIAPTYYRYSRVDKLTFATENVAPVPGANTVLSLQNSCGASSSLAAYFSGGAPGPVSTTQKLTFSEETTAAIPGAALSGNRDSPRTGASSSAMYMCGGVVPGSVPLSTVDKLIFSTDTTSVTPSAALNGTRYVGGMAGNATKGYYGGGLRYTGSYVGLSDINKINYSTDTTQLIGASLSRSSWNIGATGNATKAYFAGGVPGSPSLSTVDKLDYVTETTTLAEPLSGTRYGVIGVSGRVNAGAYTSNIL